MMKAPKFVSVVAQWQDEDNRLQKTTVSAGQTVGVFGYHTLHGIAQDGSVWRLDPSLGAWVSIDDQVD
jgi:hypothetical protein